MNNIKKLNRGFTIIEVVLVLAIAGLILLMVFIALPALQAGQRDTARKNDVSIVASAFTTAKSNNKGTQPAIAALRTYVKDVSDNTTVANLNYYNTANNKVTFQTNTNDPLTLGAIWVAPGRICDKVSAGGVELKPGTKTQFAVFTKLEGGNGTGYCL